MFIHRFFLFFITATLTITSSLLHAEIKGKVDVGFVYIDIDILESGKTIETLHTKGVRGDATVLLYQGFCIKPSFTWAQGKGTLTSGTIAAGYYIPICNSLKILPSVGITFSYLETRIDLEPFNLFNLKERFRSESPFLGLEVCYSITDRWTLMGVYQYGWSHTHTKIKPVVSSKSHSCGPNYSLGIEYTLSQNWAISLAGGYNIMLSKEKHGLRGKGAKLGIAYYF